MKEHEVGLTDRQIKVLEAKIQTEGDKAIGKKLKIKAKTARAHLNDARKRLGTSGTFQTIVKAAENKLLDLKEGLILSKVELLNRLSPTQFLILKESIGVDGKLKSAKEVADEQGKSFFTVKSQREAVRKRLGVGIVAAGLIMVVALATGFEYKRRKRNSSS